jgi:uncharacterized protein YraI
MGGRKTASRISFWRQLPTATRILLVLGIYLALILVLLVLLRTARLPFLQQDLRAWMRGEPAPTATFTPEPGVTAAPTATFAPDVAWLVASANTPIRSSPDENAATLAMLEKDQTALIVGSSPDRQFWAIQAPYIDGPAWVWSGQVVVQNPDKAPVMSEGQAAAIPTEQMPLLETTNNVNVRRFPDLNSVRLSVIRIGETVPAVGVSEDGFWYAIRLDDGRLGWVSKDYVKTTNAQNIPVITVAPASLGTLVPSPVPGRAYLLAAWAVNVRAGPGREYQVVGQLEQGQTAQIVGVSADGKWWAIAFNGAQNERGWVAADYVQAMNVEGVPVIK